MYAILKTGGKQYKVQAGDVIRVEKLMKDIGVEFDFTDILCVGGEETFLGAPILENAKVTVVVTNQTKAPKVIVFKKKRRQGYRRLKGHRQLYTELFVKAITAPNGQTVKADGEPHVFDPAKKELRLKRLAEEKAAAPKVAKKVAKKAAPKKKTAKKTAAKKKTATKKKTAKKTATKKKTAKKKASGKKKTKRS
ncbi:MAG: 50S ribosomal protein L21 [Bdellovibrionaceae bacterium]|nr:50S ribosomal protein L21 [Pseudobdellovibrionaceae bacterium]